MQKYVDDIMNLFQDYKIEKHTYDEKGYDFLDVGQYFITIIIKIAVARRREEQIDARGMVKNLIIGIVIAAVIAVGAPLLINGLSSWLAW